jgi:hypothetical protein
MTKAYDAILAVRALHKPVPSNVTCDAETWAPDHYGQAVDPYWIRCGLSGRHDEHGDPGNTGCTWSLTNAERRAQSRIPAVCDEDDQPHPCPTLQLLADVPPPSKVALG